MLYHRRRICTALLCTLLFIFIITCSKEVTSLRPSRSSSPSPPPPSSSPSSTSSSFASSSPTSHHTSFLLPFHLSLGFLGFSGDGSRSARMPIDQLQTRMQQSAPTHEPANTWRKESCGVEYQVSYSVQHLQSTILRRVESALKENMILQGYTADRVAIFDIHVHKIINVIDDIYHREFTRMPMSHAEASAPLSMQASRDTPPYVILVINPDKVRMNPLATQPYIYRYRYDGGAPTQQWLAQKRYFFVDLSAGPITYGRLDDAQSGGGTVTVGSVPILELVLEDKEEGAKDKSMKVSHLFMSSLSTFLLDSIAHLFLPDITQSHIKYSEKVIIPLIVFRNHKKWHPLRQEGGEESLGADGAAGPINPYKIDLNRTRSEVSKLLVKSSTLASAPYEQELSFIHGTHYLHDHKHIQLAIFKSLRTKSMHTATQDGGFNTYTQYLDSKLLIQELEAISDDVISPLLRAETLSSAPAPDTLIPGAKNPTTRGHRILPVFVLSLVGLPEAVLLDSDSLYVSTSRMVLVLQTNQQHIPTQYFTDGHGITLDGRRVTRHIISGVVSALGGIPPIYQRMHVSNMNEVHQRSSVEVRQNYLFTHGALPFGIFSNTSSVSILLADIAMRNSVTSRIRNAWRILEDVKEGMRVFQEEYSQAQSDFDSISEDQLIVRDVLQRLQPQLTSLSNQFISFRETFLINRWLTSNALSGTIHTQVKEFRTYVENELKEARQRLGCCKKVYVNRVGGEGWIFFAIFIPLVILIVALLLCFGLQYLFAPSSQSKSFGMRGTSEMLRPTLSALARKERQW